MTVTKRLVKGTPLTHLEMDANFDHLTDHIASITSSAGSASVGFIQSGGGADAETVQDTLRRVKFSGQYVTLQQALNAAAGGILYIEGTNAITSPLTPASNTIIEFLPGATITVAGGLFGTGDAIFKINEKDGVTIRGHGATITGTREGSGASLIWQGVTVAGSTNIRVHDLNCANMAGDGFLITGSDDGTPIYSENVWLVDCKANNCMRQGLSITSARNVWVVNGVFTGTNGKSPEAGVDIEPDSTSDLLENINVINVRCSDNSGMGLMVYLGAWNSASNYCSINVVDIYTNNNASSSESSNRGAGVEARRCLSTTPPNGVINFIRPVCVDEQRCGVRVFDWDVNGPRVNIIDPTVINPNQSAGVAAELNGGIICYSSGSHTTTPGNVRIVRPKVIDDDGNLSSVNPYQFTDSGGGWSDVEMTDPDYIFGGTNPWTVASTTKRLSIRSLKEHSVATTTDLTITDGRYIGRVITNNGASGNITVTLPQATADRVGWRWAVRNVENNVVVNIDCNAADKIGPLGIDGSTGQLILADRIGAEVELEVQEAGFWRIVRQVGDWVREGGTATPTYAPSNVSIDRTYDADATSTAELADILGTLIGDLQKKGILA